VDLVKSFKEKLAAGFVIGPFSKTSDPAFIEAMGYGGFDFVILDLEHGPNNVESLQHLIRAAEVAEIFPVVRVKENNLSLIGEVLDIGAGGIQVPQISGRAGIEKVLEAARFAPEGMRGVCRFVRAAGYSSTDRFEYFRRANEAVIILQLEGKEAIANLDEILDTGGADILFIGPYDLSQSLGVPGEISHPKVLDKMREIVRRSTDRGSVVGTFVDTLSDAKRWRDLGVRYLSYSVDVGLFYEICRDTADKIRNL
jgi:4-hydroxy-2-oxoheptanedioate aldolase